MFVYFFLFLRFLGVFFLQGVVTPQVSVQGYPGTPGTVQATQPGTAFKKSRFVKHETIDTYLSISMGRDGGIKFKMRVV